MPIKVDKMPQEIITSQTNLFDPIITNEAPIQIDDSSIIFSVHGEPIPGSQLQMNRKTGHIYRPPEHKQRVFSVHEYARHALSQMGFTDVPFYGRDTPVNLSVLFFFGYRKIDFGTGKNANKLKNSAPKFMLGKKDLDNLLKPLKDGMQGVIYHDDKQVVEYGYITKRYSLNPHTKIKLEIAH